MSVLPFSCLACLLDGNTNSSAYSKKTSYYGSTVIIALPHKVNCYHGLTNFEVDSGSSFNLFFRRCRRFREGGLFKDS
ncbi:uncharacterized protein BDZ99DRAFT_41336 [Mytilinidion resinicola]|uniref:Uncharacterized protein n=1 Tax=Mytilinidion resinicola TaxID=574789 RepID=A0A6A6YLL4_9PEZI|nr:uncharacterized protein BDZ99DRAFT_41336 [Mytilinidion resinicola]KAF2808874.1 hypothetical protein BDZ99DRAFT_41336 [Mytilinidion resinicola]